MGLPDCGGSSGFARFPGIQSRKEFTDTLLALHPELEDRMYLPQGRPEIIFDDLTPQELDIVRQALVDRGQWFEDVQFEI
jgi:hypothetical protein